MRRLTSSLLLLGLGFGAAVLLLSDRAPGLYRRSVDRVLDLAADARDRAGLHDLVHRDDLPLAATSAGHIALFAALTVVAGVVLRHRARPWLVATVAFAVSAAFEVAQPLLSRSRLQEVDDLRANAVGVLLGFVALTLVLRIRRLRRSRSLAW
jgi:VanZ like family